MSSKITATGNVYWPREAYEFITNQVTKKSAGDFLKSQLLKYQLQAEDWEELYQYLKTIEGEFDSWLGEEEKRVLDKYFSVHYDEVGYTGDMVLFFDELNTNETMIEFKNRMANLTQEEIDTGFAERLLGMGNGMGGVEDEDEDTKKAPITPLIIMQYIEDLTLEDQEKWKIQEIYLHFREHSEKVIQLLESVYQLMIRDAIKIEKFQNEFQDYWTKKMKTESIYEMLRRDLQLDIDENPQGVVIYPSLIQLSTIKVAENGEKERDRSKTFFGLGILFGKDYSFSREVKESNKEQDLFVILKLLSDKSKFEILQFAADDWRYGSEIAKSMKLTSATISYHMNTLLQARLVEIKKEEKKVFFRQNKAYLSEMLVFCEKLLQNK